MAKACGEDSTTNATEANVHMRWTVHLIEILLPLYDNEGTPIDDREFTRVSDELTRQFGGLTAFTREPAEGRWKKDAEAHRDQIVIFEVMTNDIDRSWWSSYREILQERFRQEVVIIRAREVERL
jgi:hypothetical protein